MSRSKKHSLLNKRFGELVAISVHPERKANIIQYVFQCDCGNKVVIPGRYMIATGRTNCGCKAQLHFPATDRVKAQMIEANSMLTGSLTRRSEILAKEYAVSPAYIRSIIRHTISRIKRASTVEDRERIYRLYNKDKGYVDHHKFVKIAEQTGFSSNTIRTIIKNKQREEIRFYNPKQEVF